MLYGTKDILFDNFILLLIFVDLEKGTGNCHEGSMLNTPSNLELNRK